MGFIYKKKGRNGRKSIERKRKSQDEFIVNNPGSYLNRKE